MALCGLLAYGVARVGADAVSAARARTAADAAALAAAGDPGDPSSVDAVARANGAEVVDVEWIGSGVRVRVRMLDGRGTEAVARARGAADDGGVVAAGPG